MRCSPAGGAERPSVSGLVKAGGSRSDARLVAATLTLVRGRALAGWRKALSEKTKLVFGVAGAFALGAAGDE